MGRVLAVKAIRDALAAAFPAPVRVATSEIPADLTGQVIVIDRIGGPDSPRMDYPRLDIDVFAPTLHEALRLAEDVRDFMRFVLPGSTVGGIVVCEVATSSAPSRRPYGNPATRRVGATYSLAVHDD